MSAQTYEVQDCIDYQPLTSNIHENRWNIQSGANISYSSEGMKINPSGYIVIEHNTVISTPCSAEYVLTGYSNNNAPAPTINLYDGATLICGFFYGNYSNQIGIYCNIEGTVTRLSSNNGKIGGIYRIEITSTGYLLYENEVLIHSVQKQSIPSTCHLRIDVGGSRMGQIKDLKIKSL